MKLRIFAKASDRLVFCLNECYNDFCFYYNYKDECLTGKKNITHKFTRNYIRDPHSVISISPRVRILMMSLSVFLTVVSAVSLSKVELPVATTSPQRPVFENTQNFQVKSVFMVGNRSLIKNVKQTAVINILKTCIL